MCVIIIKQKENKISRETLKTCSKINPHGLGVVWLDTFKVSYHNSKEYKILNTTRPYIAHFRYATVGKVNKENTHPFICGNNSDELLMMNGTIQGIGNDLMCDSKVLAIALGRLKRQNWKQELTKYECRFTTINTRTRTFQMYNKELWTQKDGVWYSKANVLQDNLVAVYGTLKKGYNNYYSYLTKSKFVGSGTTKDRYPLVVQGLPYMVNKKGVGHNVEVDVFKVSDGVLKRLDQLERHPEWYKREKIDIVTKGKTLSCWVYFNPKDITKHTTLHKSYVQQVYKPYTPAFTFRDSSPTLWDRPIPKVQKHEWEDMVDSESKPYCVDCYHDLEFDGFSNYLCNGCGQWFSETEVATNLI